MVRNETRRRLDVFNFSSTVPDGVGPYREVFEQIARDAPFEFEGILNRRVRVNTAIREGENWFVEMYLILDRVEILEVSEEPTDGDRPTFVSPPENKSFATRTCAVFHLPTKTCIIEYVRSGPKKFDFEEILSRKAFEVSRKQGAHFALTPVIASSFFDEVDALESVREVRAIFERPNPGWDDLPMLAEELEGSGEARRELAVVAARGGSLQKNRGILRALRRMLMGRSPSVAEVVVKGRRPGDTANTTLRATNSVTRHSTSLPITENENVYRRRFLSAVLPFIDPNAQQ